MKILIIDDDHDVRRVIAAILSRFHQVTTSVLRKDITKNLDNEIFIINAQQPPSDISLMDTISIISHSIPNVPTNHLPIIILTDGSLIPNTSLLTFEKPFSIEDLLTATNHMFVLNEKDKL